MFIVAQFAMTPNWQQPKCPSAGEWINKLVYLYTGVAFSDKKEQNSYTSNTV